MPIRQKKRKKFFQINQIKADLFISTLMQKLENVNNISKQARDDADILIL